MGFLHRYVILCISVMMRKKQGVVLVTQRLEDIGLQRETTKALFLLNISSSCKVPKRCFSDSVCLGCFPSSGGLLSADHRCSGGL